MIMEECIMQEQKEKCTKKEIDTTENMCKISGGVEAVMPLLRKILVVDDNRINRRILCKVLSKDYDVIQAENGKEALEVLHSSYENISAVLLDIVMPVMDGYEVLRQMHMDSFLSQIPVIVTTGNDDQDTEVKALSLGAHDFLVKPYKPAIIMHRLANTINLRETAALVNAVERDELTGVYSKEFFYKKAELLLRENVNKRYDIVCMDIERFKLINDLFGIRIGDDLLKHIANLLQEFVKGDGICGRVGVDKFACLIPYQENYDSDIFSEEIEKINQFPINISITVCYGIYHIDDMTVPLNVMCDRALIACNSIKGKYDVHHAYYNDAFRQRMLSEQVVIDNMKNAITEKQFQVYYQPKYDLETETIAGAEALVRWIHPEKGFMSPGEFIPLFEKNGFITDLDIYVWDTVCQNIKAWTQAGLHIVPVSVNVSRADIYNPGLADVLIGLVEKYQIDIKYLHLEITETAYTENPEQIIAAVTKLRNLGFVIEMDDFGTGYSSLNMLSELPIQILKLDIKFIQNETKKKNNKSILGFIVSLAKWLNLLIVAEGVETTKQAKILKGLSCDFAQGYYYARPMPMENFEKELRSILLDENFEKIDAAEALSDAQIPMILPKRDMLIIDDVKEDSTFLAEAFEETYHVREIADTKEALAYIEENQENLAVVLMNLFMREQDSFEIFAKLREDEKYSNIPVIVTAYPEGDHEAKALGMGAAEFISKPYSKEVVQHRVNNVMTESKLLILERERQLSKEIELVKYRAEHDVLTGLYNRFAIENIGNKFFAERKELDSIMMIIKINDFNQINENLRHKKGDDLLVCIANKLAGSFRDGDIVSRAGGGEFAIFIPSAIALKDLERRAQMICRQLSIVFDEVDITVSMGIAIAPEHGTDYPTLYRHAQAALLEVKDQVTRQYKIFDTDCEKTEKKLEMKNDKLIYVLSALQTGAIKCAADENWTVLEAKDEFYDKIGYTKEEFADKFSNHLAEILNMDGIDGDKKT
ncbi:MAG: EAL domain-containing protein [Clostridia bacterium]|nr:EAL domain-containing protein [Clostridia bacterium]